LYSKTANLAISNLVDLLGQHTRKELIVLLQKLFETIYGRPEYALPVRHNVQFINHYQIAMLKMVSFIDHSQDLLKRFEAIVGGTYATNKEE
jgi:hypothetical protein